MVINFNYINVYLGCGFVRLIVGNIFGIIMDVNEIIGIDDKYVLVYKLLGNVYGK